jgi:hypothetical protein
MARFLRNPETQRRRCMHTVVDDGSATLTLEICASGRSATFILDDEGRQIVAQRGWSRYISFNETA